MPRSFFLGGLPGFRLATICRSGSVCNYVGGEGPRRSLAGTLSPESGGIRGDDPSLSLAGIRSSVPGRASFVGVDGWAARVGWRISSAVSSNWPCSSANRTRSRLAALSVGSGCEAYWSIASLTSSIAFSKAFTGRACVPRHSVCPCWIVWRGVPLAKISCAELDALVCVFTGV